MGLAPQQMQAHVDFDLREVTILVRRPLDIKPTAFKVPFGVLKGILTTILKAEAEDELTFLSKAGDATQESAPSGSNQVEVKG